MGADQTNDSYIIRVVGQYNDELDGTVRLRARLFGMDQQNVYMSNSTAATATGTSMVASGHAISKEKLAEAAAVTTEDLKQEEPLESSVVEGVAEEEEMPIEENQEDILINDIAAEEQVEPQEDFPQSAVSVPDDEEESTAATEQEENQAESPTVSAAVGGDELSISFDITPQAAPAETKEDLTEETESSDGKEETSAAPLPMPGRRPPRRHSRFQNTTRSNHSLRHLRRF